jgi:AcrR family transcriptional regulator
LSKGALYWYFESKKELFLFMFQEITGQFSQALEVLADDEETSPVEKLRAGLTLFRTELEEMVPLFGVMIKAWMLTRHDRNVERLTRKLYEPYLNIVSRIIEEGVASGEFRADSPRATAMVVMTLLDGIALALGTGL